MGGQRGCSPILHLTTTRVLSSDDRPRSVEHVQPVGHAGCRAAILLEAGTRSKERALTNNYQQNAKYFDYQ